MKIRDFQTRILADIKRELVGGRLELGRLSDIAIATLELSHSHPEGIEHSDILAFALRFPECHFEITEEIAREGQKADEYAAEELRSLIRKKTYE